MESLQIADTDVIIDFFSGAQPFAGAVADLIRRECLALSAVTVFELYAGVTGAKRLAQIDALISVSVVFPFGAEEALAAAAIYSDLRNKGRLIGIQDILIAGTCLARNRALLTRNLDHFSRIPHLTFALLK